MKPDDEQLKSKPAQGSTQETFLKENQETQENHYAME
jgi:hypothetical protein